MRGPTSIDWTRRDSNARETTWRTGETFGCGRSLPSGHRTRDPQRTHSHAALGMALASLGQSAEAMPHLTGSDPAGRERSGGRQRARGSAAAVRSDAEARAVFEAALARPPVGHQPRAQPGALVGHWREDGEDRRGTAHCGWPVPWSRRPTGRDARAVETLATALAANGRMAEAGATNARAAALATAAGDRDLAVQITARGRAYRSPGQ